MTGPTIVALFMLGGVFLILGAALLKYGVDSAMKMWSVMGALTGVGFGSITTYFFADQKYQMEVSNLQAQVSAAETALAAAGDTAREMRQLSYELEQRGTLSAGDFGQLASRSMTLQRALDMFAAYRSESPHSESDTADAPAEE